MIVVNGCPKAGSHAVMALLDTMGLRRMPGTILPMGAGVYVEGLPVVSFAAIKAIPDNVYILAHVPFQCDLSGFRIITIIRDPRDVLVSYCRHRKREDGLSITIQQALKGFWNWGPFVPLYRSFLGWIGHSIIIRYEHMPAAMVGDGSGIYRQGKDWNTRTGAPSYWMNAWSDKIDAAWKRAGGLELLKQAGYT